jgi:hypothetical protein
MVDKKNCYTANSNEDFKTLIEDVVSSKLPDTSAEALATAKTRDIKVVAKELKKYYEMVLKK